MESRIKGSTMPVLEIDLQPGESIVSESGELSWMTASIGLHTTTQKAGGGGFFGTVKRAAGGGSLFMTEYTPQGSPGSIAFAAKMPGHILEIPMQQGETYILHRHGYLASTPSIELSVAFQRSLGTGIFGGEGFRLQKVGALEPGILWAELSGEVIPYSLAPGETLRVHPGHVGLFDATISFDITTLPGIKNKLFGGDGIFLAALTGPGRVWLQSLPLANLAHALAPYLNVNTEAAASGGASGAVVSNVLKGLMNGS